MAKKIFFDTFYDFLASSGEGFSLRKAGNKSKIFDTWYPCFQGLHGLQKVF